MSAAACLGRGDPVAPAGDLAAQYAEIVEHAAGTRHTAPRPPWAHDTPITPIATKQLVATLARENDLEPGPSHRAGERPGRQDRVIGGRVIDGRDDLGQQFPEICLV